MKTLRLIEQTSSTKAKADLLKQLTEDEKAIIYLGLNPDLVYHTTKVNPKSISKVNNRSVLDLKDQCNFLASKKALTNADREMVDSFLEQCDAEHQLWFSRVLLKDLRLGIDAKSVNKVYKSFIPTYELALADIYEEEKHKERLAHSMFDIKLDGIRALAKVTDGQVYIRTRNGKAINNFVDISRELSEMPNGIYDGEIYLHKDNGFQELTQYITKGQPAPSDLGIRFYIFDYLTLSEWESDKATPKFTDRRKRLEKLVNITDKNAFTSPYKAHLGIVNCFECVSTQHLNTRLYEALDEGYEGLMIKDINGEYLKKRSKNILKYKVFRSLEGKVIDFVEGEGRLTGTLGKLVLKLPDDQTFGCGSGFDDETRAKIWSDKQSYLGKSVEVKYQELTKDDIPRFPTFLRFRDDLL